MSDPQLPREVRRRLAIIQHAEEVTGNVAITCYVTSRRPRHRPNATHLDVVSKILYLR